MLSPPPRRAPSDDGPSGRVAVASVRAAVPAWVVARLTVLITLAGAHALVGRLRAVPEPIRRHVGQGLLGWDAERYLQIAATGYAGLPRVELRFFPLLPLLVRFLDPVLPGGPGVSLLVLVNLAALAFGAVLHRLARTETGDDDLARRAAWFAALFPAGFVLVWGYTEALWCAVTAAALLAVRRRRWAAAIPLAASAGLLRPVGVLLVVPLAVEAVVWVRGTERSWRRLPVVASAVAAPAVATGAYLAWVGRTFGDPFLPLSIQQTGTFRGEARDPARAIWPAAVELARGHLTLDSLRVGWVVVLVGLLVVAWRRWPPSFAAFGTAVVLVAASTSHLGSFERYTFTAFPVLLALASVTARPAVERTLLAAGGALLGVYGLLALLGGYVP